MPSFYRPKHSVTIPEADRCEATPATAREPSPHDTRNEGESVWAGRRKAQPAQIILPATRRWMNSLPPDYRPNSLAIRFPRIANLIAANWENPKDCTAYIHSLLHDDRGGRKGFPIEVQKDIADLHIYYTMLHPIINWDDGGIPKTRR